MMATLITENSHPKYNIILKRENVKYCPLRPTKRETSGHLYRQAMC